MVTRDAARPSRAPRPGRRARCLDPGLGLRALRPRDRAGERRAEPLREVAAGAGGARLRAGPAAGRARADDRGRGRPPHPGRERRAHGGAVPALEDRRGTRHGPLGASAPTSAVARSGRSRASFSGGPCATRCPRAGRSSRRAPAARRPRRRAAAARHVGHPRQDGRGREAHAWRRGRRLVHRAELRGGAWRPRPRWRSARRPLPDRYRVSGSSFAASRSCGA